MVSAQHKLSTEVGAIVGTIEGEDVGLELILV
jgi:hypothetical protein